MIVLLIIVGLVIAAFLWFYWQTDWSVPTDAGDRVKPATVTKSYTTPTGFGGDAAMNRGIEKMAAAGYEVAAMANAPSAFGAKWTRTVVTFRLTASTE